MSVAKYYPFNGRRGRLRLGLSQIASSHWLQYEKDFAERIQQKKLLLKSNYSRVLAAQQNSIDAQREFLALLSAHLEKYHATKFIVSAESIECTVDNSFYLLSDYEKCPLELTSYLIGDDVCLLQETNDDFILVAASVCAPTWWDLQEKMGKPLTEIHAPIANLEDKIGRMIRHFLKNLKTDDCYQRSNWFLFARPDYCIFPNSFDFYSDMKNVNLNNIESTLYLRGERQTFRRLGRTNHIVFGIKVYVDPISIVKDYPAIAEDLYLALQTMSEEQKDSLGITIIEQPLRGYLEQVLNVED